MIYPADYSGVLAVGSVNSNNVRSVFSSTGSALGIVTPGEDVLTTASTSQSAYALVSGTSVSSAVASGVAALVASADSDWSNSKVISQLEGTAEKIVSMQGQFFTSEYGYGLIQPYAAMASLTPYAASFSSQSNYPTLTNGQTQTMTVSYLNTGSYTWQRGVVNLGLLNPNGSYGTSYSLATGWVSSDRLARLNEASVAPGQVGSFTFQVTDNNLAAGNYRLDAGLVADGVTWFSPNTHAWWNVNVQ